ncbi:hypothetical protein EMCG_04009 [[Emmonsia] crescens]|uniref:Uncharacterized protein n=1 Tax=[Emmonsia] crescens TaxID=73230 RepID=A0A0G2IZD8_9EURO|nr:hypothetical protein EMCG_04009 [Emmonsia crescens UAMH 3008]
MKYPQLQSTIDREEKKDKRWLRKEERKKEAKASGNVREEERLRERRAFGGEAEPKEQWSREAKKHGRRSPDWTGLLKSNAPGSVFGETSKQLWPDPALLRLLREKTLESKVDGDKVACSPGSRPKNVSALA